MLRSYNRQLMFYLYPGLLYTQGQNAVRRHHNEQINLSRSKSSGVDWRGKGPDQRGHLYSGYSAPANQSWYLSKQFGAMSFSYLHSLQPNIEASIHHQLPFDFPITARYFQSLYFTGFSLAQQVDDLLVT